MRYVEQMGYLDPLTESGTIVTNNITASCCQYSQTNLICSPMCVIILDASFPHHLADLALLPAKMFPELLLDNQESQSEEGTRTYITVMKWIGRYF